VDAGSSREGNSDARLKEKQRDLKRISKALEAVTQKLAENETEIEATNQSLQSTRKQHAEKSQAIEKMRAMIEQHRTNLKKTAKKRSQLTAQLTEVQNQIRGLGVLPDAAHSAQYMNMEQQRAMNRLHKVREALKKYGHVNKKAVEQFQQFEKQRDTLEDRRKDLDTSDVSIRDLIRHLDQRKDEAIERTFKQVSREFASIFSQLVPAGKGRLIIQRRTDKQPGPASGDDSDDEAAQRSGVENYTGVGIAVSFNSKHDEQQRIQQLSGGQKCLCALTLIFAIQASDPAPFYLFDEIDANLDAQYRTAVAELLKSSAESGQFICTTFRPEMLRVADKCYSVGYGSAKNSKIGGVSREGALDFIEGEIGGTQK
jgi:structural maintenance of chromosome 3 (chondroitin sulfate proteoglycan 6)